VIIARVDDINPANEAMPYHQGYSDTVVDTSVISHQDFIGEDEHVDSNYYHPTGEDMYINNFDEGDKLIFQQIGDSKIAHALMNTHLDGDRAAYTYGAVGATGYDVAYDGSGITLTYENALGEDWINVFGPESTFQGFVDSPHSIRLDGATNLNGDNILFPDSEIQTNFGNESAVLSAMLQGSTLAAGDNGDVLEGNIGSDRLIGGAGDDIMFANIGYGEDFYAMVGGLTFTADYFEGKGGDDFMVGEDYFGEDFFIFDVSSATGHDMIANFDAGEDFIVLNNLGENDTYELTKDGNDTLITFSNDDDTIRLIGVDNTDNIYVIENANQGFMPPV
jgi:hypothetical protein